jgi:apolipoprotein N-acyltransferase
MKNRRRTTLGLTIAGAALLWASLPPLDLWPLAWFAPVPWILIIRRKTLDPARAGMSRLAADGTSAIGQKSPPYRRRLNGLFHAAFGTDGSHPYRTIWLVAVAFWMAALHWMRLPHWSLYFAWVLLGIYLGFYLPVFIGLSRIAVHRLRVPVVLAAPITWTGLELLRAHLLSGFSMAAISHTQYGWIELIQIGDLAGQYGVDFVMLFVAACIARALPCDERPKTFWPLVPAAVLLGAVLVYGHFRVLEGVDNLANNNVPSANVLLVQEVFDVELIADAAINEKIHKQTYNKYLTLSENAAAKAIADKKPVDLIAWPETVFCRSMYTWDERPAKPAEFDGSEAEFLSQLEKEAQQTRDLLSDTAQILQAPMIVGLSAYHFGEKDLRSFNSAVFVECGGEISDRPRYDKMHPVMVAEYIPLVDNLPWLQNLMPLGGCLTPGKSSVVYEINGRSCTLRLMPNICYESVMSHVIRGQVNQLRSRQEEPDALINLTNDGWHWGSSELDMHLACGVFRAVECRKPFLIAANTGISAHIDGNGKILQRSGKRVPCAILAQVEKDGRSSFYLEYGDWPAGVCLIACAFFAMAGFWSRPRKGGK